MGFLEKLTKHAVQDPATGQIHLFDSPEQAGQAAAAMQGVADASAQAQMAQPATATVDNQIPAPGQPVDPGFTQPAETVAPTPPMPKVVQPSFEQASTDQYGMPVKGMGGMTRLGKLIQVLVAAGQGALAGRAASEQAVAQSGGHRSGGVGLGFQAGSDEAYRSAQQERQNQMGAMQAQMQQQQMQPIDTPMGRLPFWQAKDIAALRKDQYITPRTGAGVFNTWTGKAVPGTEPPAKKESSGTVDQQAVDYLTSTPDPKLGRPLNPVEALDRIQQTKQDVKPENVPKQPFDVWHRNFTATEGREPTPKEITDFQKQSAQATHVVVNPLVTKTDVNDIADAIENGDQPPTLQGLYRNGAPVRAELARRGFPLAKMETDWRAVQKHMATLNGQQQTRLVQSISSASDLLDKVDGLYGEWKQLAPVSGFKIANHAALVAMKNLPGRAGAVANALDTQISELTADLGSIYMGGNTPTDQALKLGAKALSSDWNPQAFEEGVKQARLNVKIRKNSIQNSPVMGVSSGSPYLPTQSQGNQTAAPPEATKVLSMSAIQRAAKDHNVSLDEAKRQAQAAGYTIQ